ncbi:fumarylacetoacetate hydrolase family protein [Govanella unica]|uniref:Fumarylacetoacetate hydrolase family protein n=1 Tax=Govanella unica TaxID=2975056 RepID=A0A9X3Z6J4_9PROT|nr:fumarylacetoacetate hydrolase family protein [Govania unica]MDA5193275.1 fumarylacetoacetate hydrolase family protein [Govania unica]
MRFVTYRNNQDAARLGMVEDGLVIDVARFGAAAGVTLPDSMLGFIDLGPTAIEFLKDLYINRNAAWLIGTSMPLGNVTLLAPIPRPRKNIFGIGLNYTDHIAESAKSLDTSAELPKQPVIFSKPPTAVISGSDPIRHNKAMTQQLDWETELAVVIGKTARNVSKDDALDYVFGYTIINDISARDCRRSGQWIVSKGQDSFAPMGPAIVTTDDIPDPHDLMITTRVNGVEKQHCSTSFMLFKVHDLIADISAVMTLEPGDIIATGTPAGVGAGRTPQEFMWPGDVLESEIHGIGTLRNPIVAV